MVNRRKRHSSYKLICLWRAFACIWLTKAVSRRMTSHCSKCLAWLNFFFLLELFVLAPLPCWQTGFIQMKESVACFHSGLLSHWLPAGFPHTWMARKYATGLAFSNFDILVYLIAQIWQCRELYYRLLKRNIHKKMSFWTIWRYITCNYAFTCIMGSVRFRVWLIEGTF